MEVSKFGPRILTNLRYYTNPIKGIYRRFKYGEPISKHHDGAILYRKPLNIKRTGDPWFDEIFIAPAGYGIEKNLVGKDGNILRQIISYKLVSEALITRYDVKNLRQQTPNILRGDVTYSLYPTNEVRKERVLGGEKAIDFFHPHEVRKEGVIGGEEAIDSFRLLQPFSYAFWSKLTTLDALKYNIKL